MNSPHPAQAADLVMFSPLPPMANGIADYAYEILRPLAREMRCVVVVEDGVQGLRAPEGVTVLQAIAYRQQEATLADAVHVYQVGNNPDHVYMLPFMARCPGVVVLHDPCLHHLLDCATLMRDDFASYTGALEAEYGVPGRVLAYHAGAHGFREKRMYFDMPMIGGMVRPARGVIVHSRYAAAKVLARAPTAAVRVVPHQYSPPPATQLTPRDKVRRQLGVAKNEVMFLSLGFATRAKRIDDALHALAAMRHRMPPFKYVIGGEIRPDELDVEQLVRSLHLEDCVITPGYIDESAFFSLIQASDVVINLRHPVGGETSGTLIRALGGGACVVVVDRGPFAEIPDDAAVKLRWGPDFPTLLAEALAKLSGDAGLRRRIGAAAAAFTGRENALGRTLAGYRAAIESAQAAPPPAWATSASWETIPPQALAALQGRAASLPAPGPALGPAPGGRALPLWFRSAAVPGSDAPCRALLLGGSAHHASLLALLGHDVEPQPFASDPAALAALLPGERMLDLAVICVDAALLPEDATSLLMQINHALAFGGMLVLSLGRTVPHPGQRHQLEARADGARLLEQTGFRVEQTAANPQAELFDAGSGGEERWWRAVKVTEFFTRYDTLELTRDERAGRPRVAAE